MNNTIIKICPVISVYDETDGERIKVRLYPNDNDVKDENIPYAYPLLPKHLHIKPKVGEFVLIILTEAGNGYSNRYYIGPIISQPQFLDKDDFIMNAMSLYPGSGKKPDVAPHTDPDTHGSFANDKDIAIYGRNKGDIILTDNDVRIRCGSRLKDKTSKSGIVFNRTDPACIHLKHTDNLRGNNDKELYRSTATVVADKINLIGNLSKTKFDVSDKDDLITDGDMQKIIDTAHRLPYGDVLVDFLKLFTRAFLNHYHPYPGEKLDSGSDEEELLEYPFDSMLSETVRIN